LERRGKARRGEWRGREGGEGGQKGIGGFTPGGKIMSTPLITIEKLYTCNDEYKYPLDSFLCHNLFAEL